MNVNMVLNTSEKLLSQRVVDINGINCLIRTPKEGEFKFVENIVVDTCIILNALVTSITNDDISEVIKNVYVIFHSENVIDIVVDVDVSYRPLFFGKKFVNNKFLRRMISNLSAKMTLETGMEFIIKIYSIEGNGIIN